MIEISDKDKVPWSFYMFVRTLEEVCSTLAHTGVDISLFLRLATCFY